jgi:hypothetical protein
MTWDAPEIELVTHAAFGTGLGALESSTAISGAFSVSVSLGSKILTLDLAAIPASQGRRVGTPINYFDLGWIGAFVNAYSIEWTELHFGSTVWWPRSPDINVIAGALQSPITGTLNVYAPLLP